MCWSLQEVRKECEYDSELAKARLEKLRRHFLGDVKMEAIEVRGLRAGNARVTSFRLLKLSQEKKDTLAKIHHEREQER